MAFVSSPGAKVLVPGGAAATVTVPVPQFTDASGNSGYSANLYTHYSQIALGSTGGGGNASLTASSGPAAAIPAGATSITMTSSATTDIFVLFGKME